jgi:hypothetical protein
VSDAIVLRPRADSPNGWQAEVDSDVAAKLRELAERADRGELAGVVVGFALPDGAFGYTWSKTSHSAALIGGSQAAAHAYIKSIVEGAA